MTAETPLNLPLLLLFVLFQYPVMLLLPVLLGWWLRRRYHVGWGLFGAGALTFIASQIIHIPVNVGLGLIGQPRAVGLWPLPALALAAGASAGFFETTARYVALRFVLRRARGWREALQFGAGHGGSESIIFGLLGLIGLINMLILRSMNPAALGLTGELAEQTMAAVDAYWRSPWYLPVLGGLERVFSITFHIAMAVLVMRAITQRQPIFILAAFLAHTAVDAWAVWSIRMLGAVWTEVGVAVVGALSLWVIVKLREEPAPLPAGDELDVAGAPLPGALPVESEGELARRIDDARYQ